MPRLYVLTSHPVGTRLKCFRNARFYTVSPGHGSSNGLVVFRDRSMAEQWRRDLSTKHRHHIRVAEYDNKDVAYLSQVLNLPVFQVSR